MPQSNYPDGVEEPGPWMDEVEMKVPYAIMKVCKRPPEYIRILDTFEGRGYSIVGFEGIVAKWLLEQPTVIVFVHDENDAWFGPFAIGNESVGRLP